MQTIALEAAGKSGRPHYRAGKKIQVGLAGHRRDAAGGDRCVFSFQHYGDTCPACGINFGRRYGDFAEGYMEVHCLISLSEIEEKHTVDPVEDLRPVCPNCHAVIHLRNPPFSIDEARRLVNRT